MNCSLIIIEVNIGDHHRKVGYIAIPVTHHCCAVLTRPLPVIPIHVWQLSIYARLSVYLYFLFHQPFHLAVHFVFLLALMV